MKKIIIYIFVFIVLCILADSGINDSMARSIDNQSPYCLSFASIGANLLESRLDSWAKLNTATNFNEMDKELVKILNLLKIPVQESAFIHQAENGVLTLKYQVTKADNSYLITLQTEKQLTCFVLTAISRQDDHTLRIDEKLLQDEYDCKSYFQYKGIINGSPDKEGRLRILQVICKCLKAKELDRYENQNLLSMAAFSPELQKNYDQVVLAGRAYNIQMAIRNDSNKRQSYVYLGIPLLLNEY